MKYLLPICATILFIACTSPIDKQLDFAETKFIEEVSYMTEKEALSKEINYYKAPQVTLRKHIRSLTGKDLIHECNKVIDNDNKKEYIQVYTPDLSDSSAFKIIREVGDIKEYAIEHPNDIIANEFEFSGIFTHYGSDKYNQRSAIIIVIPQLDRYILNQTFD